MLESDVGTAVSGLKGSTVALSKHPVWSWTPMQTLSSTMPKMICGIMTDNGRLPQYTPIIRNIMKASLLISPDRSASKDFTPSIPDPPWNTENSWSNQSLLPHHARHSVYPPRGLLCPTFTTLGKANHSGMSSPLRKRLRNLVPPAMPRVTRTVPGQEVVTEVRGTEPFTQNVNASNSVSLGHC